MPIIASVTLSQKLFVSEGRDRDIGGRFTPKAPEIWGKDVFCCTDKAKVKEFGDKLARIRSQAGG